MTRQLRVGTRRSPLARIQTKEVVRHLKSIDPKLEILTKTISTLGDQIQGPLPTTNPGIFTSALETALLREEIDVAVHSLKDLPTDQPQELIIIAIPRRKSAFDTLVTVSGHTLSELPHGIEIATSSIRRTAQLLYFRPDLNIVPLRGNIDTRLDRVMSGQIEAIVLAEAGLLRLETPERFQQQIPLDLMIPAPGQGALALECRKDDWEITHILRNLDCSATRAAVTAERTFLAVTGSGCAIPLGAFAEYTDPTIHLHGEVLSPNGAQRVRVSGEGSDPLELGRRMAHEANQMGAKELLR